MRKGRRLSLIGGVAAVALLASGAAWLPMRAATDALATATVGLNAGPIALDARAGRAFVVNMDGTSGLAPREWWLEWYPHDLPNGTVSMVAIS